MAIVAAAASLCLLLSGHLGGNDSAGVARSVLTGPVTWLRLSGDVRFPGLYPLYANIMTSDVILLAHPLCETPSSFGTVPARAGINLQVSCLSPEGQPVITATSMSSSERLVLDIPVDVNHATAADLEEIPGIGPVLAERIVEFRQKNGEFKKLEELVMVQGIGQGKLTQLSKHLQVAGTAAQY